VFYTELRRQATGWRAAMLKVVGSSIWYSLWSGAAVFHILGTNPVIHPQGGSAMTIHRIRLLGDPILRAKCEPITKPKSTAVRVIMDDMRETLRDWQSRFGSGRAIAAPQIGAPVRMVYVEMDQPWTLINPEIVDIGNEDFEVWDDCFSFPNLLVRVSRAYKIRVKYQDLKGEWTEVEVEGDRAELLQHEIDHVDGVLAVDRPHGLDPFCLREEWHRLHGPNGRYGPPEPRSESYANQLVDG
jgi:peptide deformylase